jgi:hypothetical protein
MSMLLLLLLFGKFGLGLDSDLSLASSTSVSSSMSSPGDSGSSWIGEEALVCSGLPSAARALRYRAKEVAEFWYSASCVFR